MCESITSDKISKDSSLIHFLPYFYVCVFVVEFDWFSRFRELKNWNNWNSEKGRILHKQKSFDTWNCRCLFLLPSINVVIGFTYQRLIQIFFLCIAAHIEHLCLRILFFSSTFPFEKWNTTMWTQLVVLLTILLYNVHLIFLSLHWSLIVSLKSEGNWQAEWGESISCSLSWF